MILNVYLGKIMIHLPMKESALLDKVQSLFPKYVIRQESAHKIQPITGADSELIIVDKQKTNIFYLNLLLLVLNRKKVTISEKGYYNNEFITDYLSKEIGKDLKGKTYSNVFDLVFDYLTEAKSEKKSSPKDFKLDQVEFSMKWLKKAQKELIQRDREERENEST
jgi:hypothetical protein